MDAKAAAAGRKRAQRTITATACEDCPSTTDLTRHHRDGDPTNNAPENVAILCRSCHTKRHWAEGYRARKAPKTCTVCGKTFTKYSHSRVKTCSRECLSEAGRRNAAKRKTHGNRWTAAR